MRLERIVLIVLTGAVPSLVGGGCTSAPTMPDVDEITRDTQIAFGTASVFINDERQKWGMRWTGESHFYLLILPEEGDEAISYDLSTDGDFYWPLAPGRYSLLGYHWQKGTEQRRGEVRAEFTVPGTGEDVYIGDIQFRGNEFVLGALIEDKFDEAGSRMAARFPSRQEPVVTRLMTMAASPGRVGGILPPCHETWHVDCADNFSGVTALSPEVRSSGFTDVGTLAPEFRWQGSSRTDVSYDLILYEAVTYTTTGVVDNFTPGRMTAYVEDLSSTSWRPPEALKPETKYYWSVRLRDGDIVSRWSTHSHFTFLIFASSSGFGQWFQFETP